MFLVYLLLRDRGDRTSANVLVKRLGKGNSEAEVAWAPVSFAQAP
jgi:hypothetical protein